jgi:hypothetical protein
MTRASASHERGARHFDICYQAGTIMLADAGMTVVYLIYLGGL